ncbi:SANT/Myb_domain [Hexamita inflata]|uniref:SANT/Myb_domain n=1 Tax=Hexamita inflata TaxID=28002 RepID=A0ABP1KHK6_9EUKA
MSTVNNKKRWSDKEEQIFNQLVKEFDKNFKRMEPFFHQRNYSQIRSHYYNQIKREKNEAKKDSIVYNEIEIPKFVPNMSVAQKPTPVSSIVVGRSCISTNEANYPEPGDSYSYALIPLFE